MNNNFVRILISGVVTTLAQRFLGLNPISFIGFAFLYWYLLLLVLLSIHYIPKRQIHL